ncbi:MAG: superoxide dismutase [Bacteroidetes bacterium]|nr:superoxide dismutase [Bacteroidota bacterium]
MKFIAIEKVILGVSQENLNPFLEEESKKVWELYKNGHLREIYFTENRDAVLILECRNKDEALDILKELPLVKNNLIEFLLNELHPYAGYERLFK